MTALDFLPERECPVTAKLSRKFYERFGDDVAGELVDWFNAVDLTYQTQLRELNDLNWERFKATLQAEVATLRGELRAEAASLRADLRNEMSAMRAELLKWMFLFWCVTMISIFGLGFFGPG